MQNKKAFSFVEIITAISIVTLLIIIGWSYYGTQTQKTLNTRIIGDIGTINNSILSYLDDEEILPTPRGNINFFGKKGENMKNEATSFGMCSSVTQNLLSDKYLKQIPTDPRTNQYYSYGKTTDNKAYEIAGILNIYGEYETKVVGNYTARKGPKGLIKEYNGPHFVYDNSTKHFPYNPRKKVILSRLKKYSENIEKKEVVKRVKIVSDEKKLKVVLDEKKLQEDKISVKNKIAKYGKIISETCFEKSCLDKTISNKSITDFKKGPEIQYIYGFDDGGLSDEFTVEIAVKGLNRNEDQAYTLFQIGDKALVLRGNQIKFGKGMMSFFGTNTEDDYTNFDNKITDNNFHIILFTYNHGYIKLKIDGEDLPITNNRKLILSNKTEMAVGVSQGIGYYNKWKSPINYLRIYRK